MLAEQCPNVAAHIHKYMKVSGNRKYNIYDVAAQLKWGTHSSVHLPVTAHAPPKFIIRINICIYNIRHGK